MPFVNLAPPIKLLRLMIFDVDGVLTSGDIDYATGDVEEKQFDVKDGLGIVMLHWAGVMTAFVSGRQSEIVAKRGQELGVDFILQGYPIKLPIYEELKKRTGLPDSAIGFMGDDLIDLDVMRQVGFASAPADAHSAVKNVAHYVCKRPAGKGAVREVVDLIFSFRTGSFAPQNFLPLPLLEFWQDRVWEKLSQEQILMVDKK